MKLTIDSVIKRNEDILASDLDGEKVMMSIKFGEYYGLGKTGSFIWDKIESPIKIQDLIEEIVSEYDVSKDDCFKDILPFLNDLVEKEIVIVTN